MVKSRSRGGQEREEPEKKLMTRSRSRTGEEREVPERKMKMGRGRSRSGAAKKSKLSLMGRGRWRTWPAKKTKLSMDPVVSVDSSTKGALEGIPRTVVCFRYSSHPEVHRFGHKLAEFGKILRGPFNLPFLHDFAYVQYSAQDAADKALQQPVKIPRLGVELICHNIDHTALDAVRQAAYNLVEPYVLPHPANTLVYVTNVNYHASHYEASLYKMRVFFSRFGEIAEGPICFEMEPKSKYGFALLVYKTEEGAKVAVQQPHKYFGYGQVYCSCNLDAIIQFYQGKFVDYLEGFAHFTVKHQLPPALRQPLGGANICAVISGGDAKRLRIW